jgi:hypothetical protein
MANQLSILSSFTHITREIEGINALVSVQYPELSSFQSFGDSFSKIFGNKRAVYLANTSQSLVHIQTVGEKIAKKEVININEIDDIKISNTTLAGERNVSLQEVSITTKTITYKTIKEKVEVQTEKKTKIKIVKKTIEVPVYQEYSFTLFPVTFLANLKYNQNQTEILQSVEMRKSLISFLQKLQVKIADKKLIEQFKAQEMTMM